jgi:hypothetical protein
MPNIEPDNTFNPVGAPAGVSPRSSPMPQQAVAMNGRTQRYFFSYGQRLMLRREDGAAGSVSITFRFYNGDNHQKNIERRYFSFSLPRTLYLPRHSYIEIENGNSAKIVVEGVAGTEPAAPPFNAGAPGAGAVVNNAALKYDEPAAQNQTLPKTFYVLPYVGRYRLPAPTIDWITCVTIKEFDPNNHQEISSSVMDVWSGTLVYRPAGTYVEIKNGNQVAYIFDKDGNGGLG